jgi:hypothetical protein
MAGIWEFGFMRNYKEGSKKSLNSKKVRGLNFLQKSEGLKFSRRVDLIHYIFKNLNKWMIIYWMVAINRIMTMAVGAKSCP